MPPALAKFNAELGSPRRLVFHYRPSESPVSEILRAVTATGLEIADISTEETDLEDIFLQLTRGAQGDARSSGQATHGRKR